MKNFKRIASVVMVLMMMLSMMLPAMAASIKITNPQVGETYNAYKVFDVTFSGDNYAYTIAKGSAWEDLVRDYTVDHDNNPDTVELNVFTLTPSATDSSILIVTVNTYEKVTTGDDGKEVKETISLFGKADAAAAAAFAAYLEASMKANMSYFTPDATGKGKDGEELVLGDNPDTTDVVETLAPGYYFVDSTMGFLCVLWNATSEVKVIEKNAEPTIVKNVWEDSINNWAVKNDADITETIYFKTTITAKKGAEKYVLYDKLDDGLVWDENVSVSLNGTNVDANNYTLNKDVDDVDDYTFSVAFTEEFLRNLKDDDIVVVSYTATFSENAVADTKYENTAQLKYGDASKTEVSTTETYTYDIDIFKHDAAENAVAGAKFIIYKNVSTLICQNDEHTTHEEECYADVVNYAKFAAGKFTGWTVEEKDATILISDSDGEIYVYGLDDDAYILEEVEAPAGYNLLDEVVDVTGEVINQYAEEQADGVVKVLNNTGSILPSTGGIGTTIFYCAGAILAVGAFVLLITKKRMGKEV